MRIKLIVVLIYSLVLCPQYILGQTDSSYEMNCQETNALTFSEALLSVCGEENVAIWLVNNALLVGSITIDIKGFVKSLNIVKDVGIGLTRKDKRKIVK